ncbi:MAG: hypothetical protein V3U52_00455 [Thermoplasmata archaeon]
MTDNDDETRLDLENIIWKFMDDHKEAISDMLRDWGKGGKRRGITFMAIIIFLAGIVGLTGYLTYLGSLPGEAFAFLVGTVLMYLFNLIGPRLQAG